MLIQIPGTQMYRDTDSMALVNKDLNGLEEYNMKRRMMANHNNEINKVKSELQSVKEDMTEIKSMLLKLLDKGSNG